MSQTTQGLERRSLEDAKTVRFRDRCNEEEVFRLLDFVAKDLSRLGRCTITGTFFGNYMFDPKAEPSASRPYGSRTRRIKGQIDYFTIGEESVQEDMLVRSNFEVLNMIKMEPYFIGLKFKGYECYDMEDLREQGFLQLYDKTRQSVEHYFKKQPLNSF